MGSLRFEVLCRAVYRFGHRHARKLSEFSAYSRRGNAWTYPITRPGVD